MTQCADCGREVDETNVEVCDFCADVFCSDCIYPFERRGYTMCLSCADQEYDDEEDEEEDGDA